MTITRSAGIGVGGWIVGGGYQGATEDLDNTVKREAELLARTFGRDIEIRFNSDQQSGGAWLVNSLKGFDGNCQVGLGAGIRYKYPLPNYKDNRIYIDTFVDKSALKDPSLANSGNPDSRYCWLEHKTVEEALAWLIANVDTDKIYK